MAGPIGRTEPPHHALNFPTVATKESPSVLKTLQKIRQLLLSYRTDLRVSSVVGAQRYIDELRTRYSGHKRLEASGFKVYSQNDEDGIIAEIFKRIGTESQRFVEFGCGDGRENNTSFLLLQGWTGLWIDGSTTNLNSVRRIWAQETGVGRLVPIHARVTADNIDRLLTESGFSGEIDLLSIDIDGNDFHIWNALKAVQPRVVCIEYNAKFPPPVEWVMPRNDMHVWDGSDWFGASLVSLEKLAREKNYALVGCNITGINAFFVRSDLARGRFAEPFLATNHFQPPRYFLTPAFHAGHPPRT